MPMAGAEANRGIHEFRWLLEKSCFDALMPEIDDIGPMMSRTVGTLAAAYNRQASPHADIFEGWQIFENSPVLEADGMIKVPQGPGLGITFRPDLIEEI